MKKPSGAAGTAARARKPSESAAREGSRSVEIAVGGVRAPSGMGRLGLFCRKVLSVTGHSAWRVGILLCDDGRIAELNGRYRRRPEATDVLSFPEEDGRERDPVEGDIVISLDALRRNADEFGVPANEEMKRLLVHGLLHLAGMDHGRGSGGRMLFLQEKLLAEFHAEKIYGEKKK